MRFRRLKACAPALLLVAVSVAACGQHDNTNALPWRAADLPVPTGWRAAPRSATWCAGHWVVVGFTANAAGLTRAAAWTSQDDGTWWPITLHPGRDYYSFRANLSSVGCSRGRLAVLGGKAGALHGGLRTRAWKQLPDGSLAALHGSLLQLGGTQGVAVSKVVGGPGGYLLTGARFSGAAVWTSHRGGFFRLHEGEPGLADSRATQTLATDAAPDADHWVVVGMSIDASGQVSAMAWRPANAGHWVPDPLPGGHTLSTADRATVAGHGDGTLVAGVLDQGFGLWAGLGGAWLLEDSFGKRNLAGTAAPYVSGLAVAAGSVLATYSDGARFHLAVISGGDQADSSLPVSVSVNGDHAVTVATHGSEALLVTDDGSAGRIWLTHVPAA